MQLTVVSADNSPDPLGLLEQTLAEIVPEVCSTWYATTHPQAKRNRSRSSLHSKLGESLIDALAVVGYNLNPDLNHYSWQFPVEEPFGFVYLLGTRLGNTDRFSINIKGPRTRDLDKQTCFLYEDDEGEPMHSLSPVVNWHCLVVDINQPDGKGLPLNVKLYLARNMQVQKTILVAESVNLIYSSPLFVPSEISSPSDEPEQVTFTLKEKDTGGDETMSQ